MRKFKNQISFGLDDVRSSSGFKTLCLVREKNNLKEIIKCARKWDLTVSYLFHSKDLNITKQKADCLSLIFPVSIDTNQS